MLHLLTQYALRYGLVAEPGFAPKSVRWGLSCTGEGAIVEAIELGQVGARRNPGQTFAMCPELSQPEIKRGGPGCRHFLVDSLDVATLYGSKEAEAPEKVRAKHVYFVNLLRQGSEVMPILGKIADSLADPGAIAAVNRKLAERHAKPADKATFLVVGFDPPFLVDSEVWRDWWRQFRRSLAGGGREGATAGARVMRCLASGELVTPAATHPKIRGLADVGGLSTGDAWASFKQESFCSYGLSQSENSAVSEGSAAAYRAALNTILQEHSIPLAGARVAHWYRKPVGREDDPLGLIESGWGDEEGQELAAQGRARRLLEAIRAGERPDLLDNHYYALTLSGASGRVMVRDWMEGGFEKLALNVTKWFDDLEIAGAGGYSVHEAAGLEKLVTSLLPERKPNQKYEDWVKPIGASRLALWHAAVRGGALPSFVLARAVDLHRSFVAKGGMDEAFDLKSRLRIRSLSLLYARMGILRAFHVRRGDQHMSPYLNEDHPDPAYHCGRLMAVLAALQNAALGDVGAGVVERYYAAASVTPKLVLGRLVRLAQFHLGKLKRDRPDLAFEFDRELASIHAAVRGDDLPAALNLHRQSVFALGYYQQKATRKRPEDKDSRKEA